MSRFYASIIGSRGEATRQGTPSSGISAHPRGWTLGIRASGYDNPDGYGDAFAVNVTGGSNGARSEVNAFTVTEADNGTLRVALSEAFGGSVFYLDRDGNRHTRSDEHDGCAYCASGEAMIHNPEPMPEDDGPTVHVIHNGQHEHEPA